MVLEVDSKLTPTFVGGGLDWVKQVEEHRESTSFITLSGHYCFCHLPFGSHLRQSVFSG